ncbi:hypothetical protein [Halorubrum sp. CBA1229]|uniref:DUF7284 family protein n=1 Tax=Halorubrum sp. CBA1229 TaxID=1853699 RepID=UPI000F41A85F|nr:hypothetical protein [Halorubrum sp. CBA1229]QKY16445.1 hypothetical protein Hrr1229_005960 [Halorubrum sp. CBA1229]
MTSTVLDVTVLLLCVSASVVALGGVGGDVGGPAPTADETADRLVTETLTVRYRTPEAANGTRTVHATRAELLALLVAGAGGSDSVERHDGATGNAFESRSREVVAAGIDGRTRIDATVPTDASAEGDAERAATDRRAADHRVVRRSTGPIAAAGTPNAPRAPHRMGTAIGPRQNDERRSTTESVGTVAVGPEPPRNADVATAVVSHPAPSGAETDEPVRIVVRRW